jgi:hypothetical protein
MSETYTTFVHLPNSLIWIVPYQCAVVQQVRKFTILTELEGSFNIKSVLFEPRFQICRLPQDFINEILNTSFSHVRAAFPSHTVFI